MKRIHQRLGTAGFIISIVALVAALSGGAYAAGGLTKAQEKQVTKIAKKYAGKPGAVGATGPVGAAGKEGARGAAGTNGTNGANGANGANGTNGLTGFTKVLPKGETLKGDWAIAANTPGTGVFEGSAATAISFGIPLGAAPEPVYVKAGETTAPAGCTGNVENPGAEAGHLCIFAAAELNNQEPAICPSAKPLTECLLTVGAEPSADPSGALIGVIDTSAGLVALNGTWAATAE
jgi:hypothetical protein